MVQDELPLPNHQAFVQGLERPRPLGRPSGGTFVDRKSLPAHWFISLSPRRRDTLCTSRGFRGSGMSRLACPYAVLWKCRCVRSCQARGKEWTLLVPGKYQTALAPRESTLGIRAWPIALSFACYFRLKSLLSYGSD